MTNCCHDTVGDESYSPISNSSPKCNHCCADGITIVTKAVECNGQLCINIHLGCIRLAVKYWICLQGSQKYIKALWSDPNMCPKYCWPLMLPFCQKES